MRIFIIYWFNVYTSKSVYTHFGELIHFETRKSNWIHFMDHYNNSSSLSLSLSLSVCRYRKSRDFALRYIQGSQSIFGNHSAEDRPAEKRSFSPCWCGIFDLYGHRYESPWNRWSEPTEIVRRDVELHFDQSPLLPWLSLCLPTAAIGPRTSGVCL